MAVRSLLDRIEDLCNVDVDDASQQVIKSLPFTPHNQTSNQAIITNELLKDEALLKDLVRQHGEQGWEKVYDLAAVHICARNVPFLSGRVLVQTSLRHVNDPDALIQQSRFFASTFAQLGIPRDRFAIKVPFSGSGAAAAKVLNAEGIRTLATAVFSLEQAIAASQSGCLFISPYFQEVAAHLDPTLRPSFEDTALEHPMSARVIHMLETFARAYKETGQEQPIMVIASHFTMAEILAMAELGCPHITISAPLLQALMSTPDSLPPVSGKKTKFRYAEFATAKRLTRLSSIDPLAGPDWDGKLATSQTDFVADGGAKLDAFIRVDPVVSKRLKDAEQFFLGMEGKARVAIEKEMAAQGP